MNTDCEKIFEEVKGWTFDSLMIAERIFDDRVQCKDGSTIIFIEDVISKLSVNDKFILLKKEKQPELLNRIREELVIQGAPEFFLEMIDYKINKALFQGVWTDYQALINNEVLSVFDYRESYESSASH